MTYQSGANLPIPNRERNEGSELEVVPSHWYPQRPRPAVHYSWRREWQPQEQWQPHEETEDDKPSEYCQSRYDRSESFYEPKRQATRHAPQRNICGLKLSTFVLSCAVVFLFAGVFVVAGLLGSKVVNLETTMSSLVTQQARVDSDSTGYDVTQGVASNGTRLDATLRTKANPDGENSDRPVAGRSADATAQKTTVSTTKSVTASTHATGSTRQSVTKSTGAGPTVAASETRPAQKTSVSSTAEESNKDEQQATKTSTAAMAVKTTRMNKRIAGWNYVGCYEDSGDRILLGDFKQRDDMTNNLCANICVSQEYKYFGTEFYNQCMCGESVARMIPVDDWRCDRKCRGNPVQEVFEPCGGEWFMSLWERH